MAVPSGAPTGASGGVPAPAEWVPQLRQGLASLGLELHDRQVDQLLGHLALIAQWNRVYNLTAVREPAQMLTHHLLDSLAVVGPLRRWLAGQGSGATGGHGDVHRAHGNDAPDPGAGAAPGRWRVLDVGSGAGLPGVAVAITCPEARVTCVDAVAKKAAFVQQVAAQLTLPNLGARHARIETLRDGAADVVVSRAFASLADFTAWSRAALAPGGVWLAMKGRRPDDEIAALPGDVEVFHVEPLTVPGLQAERCLVWLRPRGGGAPTAAPTASRS